MIWPDKTIIAHLNLVCLVWSKNSCENKFSCFCISWRGGKETRLRKANV